MNIAFVALGAYPLFNETCKATFGGAEVQLMLLAKELAKRPKLQVSVLVSDHGQEYCQQIDRVHVINTGIVKNRGGSKISPLSVAISLWKAIRTSGADIIVQRAASEGTGLIKGITSLQRKKFVYMTAHEIDCNGIFEKENGFIKGILYKYGIRKAEKVITQSTEHKILLQKHHGVSAQVLPSGYPIPKQETKKGKYVLWVGRAEKWKRPDICLKLAHEFPSEKFVMLAPKSNTNAEEFSRIESEAKQLSNVTFIDYIPFSQVLSLYQGASIFLLTSEYEGFPNTLLQACLTSTPTLSLSVDPDGVIQKYNMGLVACDDIKTYKAQITRVLSDVHLQEVLGRNARKYVIERHDIECVVNEFYSILKEL